MLNRPSKAAIRPFGLIIALMAALAVGLWLLLPGGLLQAQYAAIEYAENGTGAVATFTAVDPEGESVVWSLETGDDMEDFEIENGVLRFKSAPDFENAADTGTDNTYDVTVQASDGGTATTAMEAVMIQVTNVEEPGTVMLSTLQPQVGVPITATLTDPDNIGTDKLSSIEWQWYRGTIAIAGGTNGAGMITSTYTPAAGDIGSVLSAKAMYDDDEGDDKTAEQESAQAAREAPTSNVSPTFPTLVGAPNTNQTREVAENTPEGTNFGAPVTANDTDVLTYSLMGGADDESFDINRATGHLITDEALDHEMKPEYTVMVRATDPFNAFVDAQVTITVTDVNEAPELAGVVSIDLAENIINLNDTETSDVTEGQFTVTDEDEDEDDNVDVDANIKWLLSGADSSKFKLTTTGATRTLSFKNAPNFESPGDSDGNNVYEVTVMVTDTDSNTDEQAVMVKVTNVEEPGMIDFSTLQPRVGFPVTATLTDPDNVNADSLGWQWYRGENLADNNMPTMECADDAPDNCLIKDATSGTYRPAAGDDGKRLTAVATYTDGHANVDDFKDMVIARADNDVLTSTVNQAPEFPEQDDEMEGRQTAQTREVAENTAAGEGIGDRVEAMDEDANLTYSLGGTNAASFDIDRGEAPATAGQLRTKAALDKEMKDAYTVTVTATDSLGLSSTITVTIKVTDVDEMPDLEGEAPEEYAENRTAAVATFRADDPEGKVITWDLTGADAEEFSIEGGVLRFEESPDYEAPVDEGTNNTYEFTIQASDGGQNTTAEMGVSIDVTNVDEDGTIMLSNLQPQVDVALEATLTDPDNVIANTVTWQWYRGNSPISGANTGEGTNISTYTPAAGDIGSTLRAEAMYDDGEGEDKTARGESFRSVRTAPGSNTAPVFPDQDTVVSGIQKQQTREVAENTLAGRNIGAPVAANDTGDLLTYSLDAPGANSFDIVRRSGQIRTKADLDFEMAPRYTVTVTATDPFDSSDSAVVTITLINVNETPTFTAGVMSIDHEEGKTVLDTDGSNGSQDAAVYTIEDEDSDDNAADLDWDLTGADGDKLELTDNGATRTLSFKDAPDFESPTDSGADNVYNVIVEVTDSDGNTAERAVTVKVTNMEEAGVIELSTLQPRIGFSTTATLTDADNITADSVSWQWYKGTVTRELLMTLDRNECVDADTNGCFIKGATSETYTPVMFDVNDTLVAVALYTDGKSNVDNAKDFAMMATTNQVLADTRNKAPVFADQDDEMEGEQTDQERMVGENVPVIGGATATMAIRTVGAPVTATDSITANDGGTIPEILTYTLGGPDADSFTIDRGTAQISTKADVPLDTETKDTYTVTVTATDPSELTATITVTITVMGVDEAPEIMVGGLAVSGMTNVDYAENGSEDVATYTALGPDADMATWSLGGDDAGDFSISSSGMLSFRSAPDFEMAMDADTDNTYMVTIKADDGTYMDTHDVTVMVTNVNEAPVGPAVADQTATEDTEFSYTVPVFTDPEGGDTITYRATLSDDIALPGWLSFDASTRELSGTPLKADTPDSLTIKVTGTDDGMPAMSDSVTFTLTVVVANQTPVFASPTDTRSVAENTHAGEDIGDPVAATDLNGDVLIYTLGGDDATFFDIDSATGQLMTKAALDYETKSSYSVTVTATDPDGEAVSVDITITVTDVNERIGVSGATAWDYAENGTGPVATYTATNPAGETIEDGSITWSLQGDDADDFDISAGGVLTFKSPPDYEAAADDDIDNIYEVTVKASDGTNEDMSAVTVTVTNVDETPEISGPTVSDYAENGTGPVATYMATDPEGEAIAWSLSGADADDFDISAGGVLTFKSPPDYEAAADDDIDNIYEVTVKASDGTNEDTSAVTVTVSNVDETPEISGPTASDYAENGTGPVATYTATDPEGEAIAWSLSGADADDFDISAGGVLTFKSPPDYEAAADDDIDNIYEVTVKASDGTNEDTSAVTVTVTDVDETPDVFDPLAEYDANNDGEIDKSEVITAINDYLFGMGDDAISKDDVSMVINLYLLG